MNTSPHITILHAKRALIWMSSVVISVALSAVLWVSYTMAVTTKTEEGTAGVTITPYTEQTNRNGTTRKVFLMPLSDGSYQLTKRTQIGLPPLSIAYPQQRDIVEISGIATPGSTVSIVVKPMNLELNSTVNDTGKWSVALLVDSLEPGIQDVIVAVNDNGIIYQTSVAQFQIITVEQLSNATWLVITLVGTMIMLLLIAVNIRFYIQRKQEDRALEGYLKM